MNPQTLADFQAHAIEEYPRECCGVVVVAKGRERYVRCANLADKPGMQFQMSHEDFTYASDLGEPIAICHSHPNLPPTPSQADLVECENARLYEWHIINVHREDDGTIATGLMHSFKPSGYQAPLVGREFYHGTLDCYALVKDYYEREHGVHLPHIDREDAWWDKGQNLYRENLIAAGFYEIPLEEARDGDGVLMTLRSPVENHAAVFVDGGRILHHVYGRLSSRDVYTGYWRENTTVALRHKGIKHE